MSLFLWYLAASRHFAKQTMALIHITASAVLFPTPHIHFIFIIVLQDLFRNLWFHQCWRIIQNLFVHLTRWYLDKGDRSWKLEYVHSELLGNENTV